MVKIIRIVMLCLLALGAAPVLAQDKTTDPNMQILLDKVKAEAAEHRATRLALMEEVKAWAAAHPDAPQGDWKSFNRALHQFSDRWRDAGHLSEKAFAEPTPGCWSVCQDRPNWMAIPPPPCDGPSEIRPRGQDDSWLLTR